MNLSFIDFHREICTLHLPWVKFKEQWAVTMRLLETNSTSKVKGTLEIESQPKGHKLFSFLSGHAFYATIKCC